MLVLDEPDVIRKKFKTAVTDSGREIRYAPDEKPGVSNLIEILSVATGLPIPEVERSYDGKGYGDLKGDVGEAVVELVRPIQTQVQRAARRRGRVAEAAAGRRRKGSQNLRDDARADVRADGVRPTVAALISYHRRVSHSTGGSFVESTDCGNSNSSRNRSVPDTPVSGAPT